MAARLAPSPGTAGANALGLGETIVPANLQGWLAGRNGAGGELAVMGFNARDFRPDAPGSFDLDFVGKITEDEARTACPYLPDVQSLLDKAARESGPIGDRSP